MVQPTRPWTFQHTVRHWLNNSPAMSKREIFFRFGPIQALWWKFIPGTIVTFKWPSGELIVDPDSPLWDWTTSAFHQKVWSSDPNDHFRPWLEKNVGIQGWDWDWKQGTYFPGDNSIHTDLLHIKFRRSKEKYITMATLLWSKYA